MTFRISGSACAPDIADRPAVAPAVVPSTTAATDLVQLLSLDRLPEHRRLVCHWQRGTDGRLAAFWEPDIALTPHR